MALYEHIYLARQDVSQQQVEELTAQLTEVLGQGGGKVTKNEYWGPQGPLLSHPQEPQGALHPAQHRRRTGRRC